LKKLERLKGNDVPVVFPSTIRASFQALITQPTVTAGTVRSKPLSSATALNYKTVRVYKR
jgi:hypothetical protein